MANHFDLDLARLKKDLVTVASMLEVALNRSLLSFFERNADLAGEVIAADEVIDQKEVEIEEFCLKLLALHQPVAGDLRFIIAVLKVNNEIERMGDLAVNIAERALYLAKHPLLVPAPDFAGMARNVQRMVTHSLDAFVNMDLALACSVLAMDDEVDTANSHMFEDLQGIMCVDSSSVKRSVHLLSISRYLERIADLATNIAEDIIYMADGEVVRHQVELQVP